MNNMWLVTPSLLAVSQVDVLGINLKIIIVNCFVNVDI